jgi:hypothetical protein
MEEKKPAEAATAYAEALATLPVTDGRGVRIKTETPRAKRLQAKLDAAKKAAKTTQIPDGRTGLQGLRTWKLGAADGLNGTAKFHVLLSSGGVAAALPIGTVSHPMQVHVEAAKWSDRFPPGMDAHVAAKVMLNCHGGTCEMIREP